MKYSENDTKDFTTEQYKHFETVEKERFIWQTKNSYIIAKEKEILNELGLEKTDSVLEVGCGEGANLVNSFSQGKMNGIDYSFKRVSFAQKNSSVGVKFACADVAFLPFCSCSFDLVFSRDLLHHLGDYKKAIAEIYRVCKKNGRIAVIEMNGRTNFIGRIFATIVKEENMMKKMDVKKVVSVLSEEGAINIKIVTKQPLLLYRVIFHHLFYFQYLTKIKVLTNFLDFIENKIGAYFIPRENWGYIIILAVKS